MSQNEVPGGIKQLLHIPDSRCSPVLLPSLSMISPLDNTWVDIPDSRCSPALQFLSLGMISDRQE